MKENIFALTTEELKGIANNLQVKIEEGLIKDGMEISDIPTHIVPKKDIKDGKVLALDWGGTNFRAAIVEFKNGNPTILEAKKKPLSAKETTGFKQDDLHREMAALISELQNLDKSVTQIGYCFSYPAKSELNGDATLLRWTKGIEISEMVGKPVGVSFLNYLNNHKSIDTTFTNIKVINDTVACLFAGLSEAGYDTYMGLIVGTGTNMASLMPLNKIEKLDSKETGLIPVNLESGNFQPPYLTVIDGLVDAMSNNKGFQRFEKAISGGYLGEIFKMVFCEEKIKYDFDGGDLAKMIRNPDEYSEEKVAVARWIEDRSAKLVAASLAGLVQVLIAQEKSIKNICLAADGSVFWSKHQNNKPYYKELVAKELQSLLPAGVSVAIIDEMSDPNLVGSAIAALS
ncbi:MAG: hexokinase [Dysgonamonadaceae bacterium]|jgi:hexokinase|nr:hexokinase [Dysgonamonadaceae bacterium]